MIGIDGPAEELLVVGRCPAWRVPEVNSFHAEGGGPGTALLVVIHNCCHVVREQLNVQGSNEGQEHLTVQVGGPQFQDVDLHPSLPECPKALSCMAFQVSTPPDTRGVWSEKCRKWVE